MFRSNIKFKIKVCLVLSSIIIVTTGCSIKNDSCKIKTPKLSEVVVEEKLGEYTNFYSINNCNLKNKQRIGELNKIQDLKYNKHKGIYVFIQDNFKGKELINNSIEILKNDKKIELNNFYSAEDIKLSKDGDRLAYRSFSKDSLSSAEGLKVYDINTKKLLKIESKVIVSGNLYSWLNNDEIIYYGTIPGKKNSAKIYKYNFNTKEEEVYVDNIKGYCTDFISVDKDILYVSSTNNQTFLIYYDKKSNIKKVVSSEIDKIYESVIDKNNDVYFIAKNKLEEKTYLYSILSKNKSLNKLTYDFPNKIDVNGGIGKDNKGNIYFLGNDKSSKNSPKNDIYVYKKEDNSVQIVSKKKSLYNIFQNKSLNN